MKIKGIIIVAGLAVSSLMSSCQKEDVTPSSRNTSEVANRKTAAVREVPEGMMIAQSELNKSK